jgi:hypothetical protein
VPCWSWRKNPSPDSTLTHLVFRPRALANRLRQTLTNFYQRTGPKTLATVIDLRATDALVDGCAV